MLYKVCLSLILFPVVLTGCGSSDSGIEIGKPSVLVEQPPLSLEEWKAMTDFTEKYDGATLERLRAGNSDLKSEKAWAQFEKEVIGPSLVKDKPIQPQI
ncbi:MAG: hypothetical protein KDA70_17765 [Planctomycetaceae bacterium]|nr:hypothetical protein [Planctomycetaceae bacterium]